ncbi:MAG: exonuclease domain-containing protein, partial [Chloroflexota bacterium]|nr:exonuclease domain-containing protein [Chloroflexota bacterium]
MVAESLLSRTYSIVDLETTGASAIYDRIVEVAVVQLVGGEVVERFETLVDPATPIPPFITRLTGISDRMVRGRPHFAAVAHHVSEALGAGPLVAHNASFDEAFLRHAFTRAGRRFALPTLCTLRLARRLVPRLPSYKLDALAAHFGIRVIGRRHRAGPDAVVTALVLRRLLELADEQGVADHEALADLQHRPVGRTRRQVDEAVIGSLPKGPGVYLLKDADGHVLYIGKSIHVRQRVRDHLRGGSPDQPRLKRRLRQIVDVEAFATGSELEALFLESRLIKRYLPDANQLLRNDKDYPFIRIDTADPFPRLETTRTPPTEGGTYFGPFRRRATAAGVVEFLTECFGLRSCGDPITPGMSACALLDFGKCLGPCVGAVDQVQYRAAVQQAADVLHGRDGALLAELIARRDALADDWRFEEAAELRDRIRELEHILGDQRRLESVADRNLAIVAQSVRPRAGEVFFIQAGLLVGQVTVTTATRPTTVARALADAFAGPAPATFTREKVDEMHLLDGWLRRHTERLTLVSVDPARSDGSVDAVLDTVRAAVSGRAATTATRKRE